MYITKKAWKEFSCNGNITRYLYFALYYDITDSIFILTKMRQNFYFLELMLQNIKEA